MYIGDRSDSESGATNKEDDMKASCITQSQHTEFTWGKDWLIEYGNDGLSHYLKLYTVKTPGACVADPDVSVTGTEKEIDDLYEWMLWGRGDSLNPAPGSLEYEVKS